MPIKLQVYIDNLDFDTGVLKEEYTTRAFE